MNLNDDLTWLLGDRLLGSSVIAKLPITYTVCGEQATAQPGNKARVVEEDPSWPGAYVLSINGGEARAVHPEMFERVAP